MVDIASLAIKIDTSDTAKAERALDQLAKTGARVEQAEKAIGSSATVAGQRMSAAAMKAAADTSKMEAAAHRASQRFGEMGSAMQTLAGLAATAFSVREIAQAAEQYALLTNKLRQVTATSEQLGFAQQSIYDIAQESLQSLETTASVYQRIAQNGKQLGLNFADVASITETVAKAVALSGASADSANASLMQFGQALASGTLRGEELNSILEQTPGLAQAIARGLGVTIGELRTLGEQGALTSERVITALENQKGAVDELAGAMQVTGGQAITAFQNSLIQTIGKLDEASGASRAFASAVLDLSRALDGFNSGAFADFFRENKQTAEGFNVEILKTMSQIRDFQGVRDRLDLDDPDDRVFFKFDLWNKAEVDAQIAELNGRVEKMRTARDKLLNAGAGVGAQTPGPASTTSSTQQSPEIRSMLEKASASAGRTDTAAKRAAAQMEREKAQAEAEAKRRLLDIERARIDVLRETGQLQQAEQAQFNLEYAEQIAYFEKQGNAEALARLETLRKIHEINAAAAAQTGTVEGVSAAPDGGGIDAMFGGAGGEFAKLAEQTAAVDEWRAIELEKQMAYLEAKAINEELYAERVANINKQHQDELTEIETARQQVALSSTEQLFGDLASMAATYAGEQSGLYRAMFAVQKAAAIAQSAIAIQQGIAMAAANPWPANLAAMASVAAATAGIVTNIAAIGMAHDGIDSVPREGTWLLDKGERVVDKRTNGDLKDFLSSRDQSSGTTSVQVVNNGQPVTARTEMNGKQLRIILDAVRNDFESGMATDGRYAKSITRTYGLQRQGR